MRPRLLLAAVLVAGIGAPAAAQHAFADPGSSFDPAVPTPRAVLGYELGSRFTTHRGMMRFLERLAAASPRVRVDTVGHTFEGREMLRVVLSSPANLARLAAIQGDNRRIADPRGAAPGVVDAAIARTPAIVWLAHSVHGGEASGVEAGLALAYQLAAGTDAATRTALDSTVVVIDPNQNPDGRERHTHDVERMGSPLFVADDPGAMNNAGSWPGPRTSHYYFDLNRDYYIQSHPETRARVRSFLAFWPHVAVDLHEMGSSSTFYFAPPREPDNQNNPPHLPKWFDIYAAAHGAAFDRHGWSYFRREGYDSFYPGYGEGWPMLTGAVGMLFESSSSSGGGVRRRDGTIRTLHQAAAEHFAAEWATVRTSASRRTELLRDYAAARANAIRTHATGGQRGVLLARDAHGRADALAALLQGNGIDVQRLTGPATFAGAVAYGTTTAFPTSALAATGRVTTVAGGVRADAGAYLVDFAQPQGHLAKALLEPDAALDSVFLRDELELRRQGFSDRFYDMTAWSLPLAWRVPAYTVPALPAGVAATLLPGEGSLAAASAGVGAAAAGAAVAAPARAAYGYAWAPGSEGSQRLLAALLRDSIRVWFAPKPFTVGAGASSATFRHGAYLVRVFPNREEVHALVARHAVAEGVAVTPVASAGVAAGTDLGSNSVVVIPRPRVALVGGAPIQGQSFGFAWYALEQRLGYPATLIDAAFLAGGDLSAYTTIVLPSVSGGALDRALGEGGKARLADWVRAGGTLITLEGASQWAAQERGGLARLRMRRDSARADSAGGAPLPSSLPGVLARATIDTNAVLLAGITEREIPVFTNSDRVFTVPRDLTAGEAIVRYAPADRVRLGGFFWPEMPARLGGSVYLWREDVGRGQLIVFAQDPVYRDQLRGTLPLFGNAVLMGGVR